MKLNKKKIRDNFSVKDIQEFLFKNYTALSYAQVKWLTSYLIKQLHENEKFVKSLSKAPIFRVAYTRLKQIEKRVTFSKILDVMRYCVIQLDNKEEYVRSKLVNEYTTFIEEQNLNREIIRLKQEFLKV